MRRVGTRKPAKNKRLAQAAGLQPKLDEWFKDGGREIALMNVAKRNGKRLDLLSHYGEDYFYSLERILIEKEDPIGNNEEVVIPSTKWCVDRAFNFNLVFIGLGSKVDFLTKIQAELNERDDVCTMRISGYARGKSTLAKKLQGALLAQFATGDRIPVCTSAHEAGRELTTLLDRRRDRHCFAVVDSICRLASDDVEILSLLAAHCAFFHLLCGVDRIGWPGLRHGRYETVTCHTMRPYEVEITRVSAKISANDDEEEDSSFIARTQQVLESVMRDDREIFFSVCELQRTSMSGITEKQLVSAMKKVCLLKRIPTFHAGSIWNKNLHEFKTHGIMVLKNDGRYMVRVEDKEQLEELIKLKSQF